MRFKSIKFVISFTILALLITAAFVGCGKKDKVIAKVGEFTITESEFKEAFVARYHTEDNAQKQSFRERKDFLDTLVDQKLILADAYRKGIDENEEVQEAKKAAQERVAVQKLLYEKEIVNKIITDASVKEHYDQTGEEVHARHILIKTQNPEDSVEVQAAFAKADSIYQLIADGGDFGELAKELSDDKSNSSKGGDLGFFGWGRMVKEFQEAAFALKIGEVSPPVKTMFGYHLIELLDRKAVERGTFEEEKDAMKEQFRQMKTNELREAAQEYIETLKADMGLVYYEDSLTFIYSKVSAPDNPHNVSLFSNFDEDERKMIVASWQKGEVTVAALDLKIGSRGSGAFQAAEDFKQVIDGIVVPEMLNVRAVELGVYDDPEALKAGRVAMETQMIRKVKQLEVDDKMNFDDESLKEYYEKNRDKYMSDSQVTIREIFVDDQKLAEELLQKAKDGQNFKKMAKKYTTRANAKKTDGELGPFGKNRYGRIGREAHKLNSGEFCDKPIRMGKKYSIFKVLEKTPSELKPFEDARKDAERDYRQNAKKDLEEQWLKQVREEIKVTVDEDALRGVLPFVQMDPPKKADDEKSAKVSKQKSLKKTETKTAKETGEKTEQTAKEEEVKKKD